MLAIPITKEKISTLHKRHLPCSITRKRGSACFVTRSIMTHRQWSASPVTSMKGRWRFRIHIALCATLRKIWTLPSSTASNTVQTAHIAMMEETAWLTSTTKRLLSPWKENMHRLTVPIATRRRNSLLGAAVEAYPQVSLWARQVIASNVMPRMIPTLRCSHPIAKPAIPPMPGLLPLGKRHPSSTPSRRASAYPYTVWIMRAIHSPALVATQEMPRALNRKAVYPAILKGMKGLLS